MPAWAQFRVEVAGIGLKQQPIAISGFKGPGAFTQKVTSIIGADLERSGLFKKIDAADVIADENTKLDAALWRQKNADALIMGSVATLADGRLDIRFRLWDVVRGQDLGGQSHAVPAADLRLTAHKIADFVYEKLTGEKGIFSTRIAYITKAGQRYTLWVADADGENAQPALNSTEPIISPAWSPNGAQLAYVSFESRKPVIYVHEIATGKRRLLANFRGSNSAPAWSPDGKQLIATLGRDGGSQIYSIDIATTEVRRLTQSSSIDTEPCYAPDGKKIYFVSDRGGTPQIYKMASDGSNVERVTFSENYNVSPAISSDGRWMAYIARVKGAFKLHLMDLNSGNTTAITETNADEHPRFSPNSRLVIYATQQNGSRALMTTTLDGKIKARLSSPSGEIREPDWAPFQR